MPKKYKNSLSETFVRWALVGFLSFFPGLLVRGQGRPEPDANPKALPVKTINYNYISGNKKYYRVTSLVVLPPGNYRIAAHLLIENGGELRITNSKVLVRGNVILRTDSKLYVRDSEFGIENYYPREFNYWWEGGHLHTERALIGGVKLGGLHNTATFWLNNGVWDAFDTTVQYSGGILLGWSMKGYQGRPDQMGGTLRADGLFQGETPDALHMSGWGDAFLKNSEFALSLYFYANGTTTGKVDLNLDPENKIAPAPKPAVVYGNPKIHTGVTNPITGSPWRLSLQNVRVPLWYLFAQESRMTAPPVTIVMHNGKNVFCKFMGKNITGSPKLGGPWSNYYKILPGLPSIRNPGWHPMPPNCSVTIANVTFQSGPNTNDWTYVRGWGLYIRGGGTNFSVTGPSQLVEIWFEDGTLSLTGGQNFNMGCHCNTIEAHGTANINIKNAALGEFGVSHTIQGEITAFGRSKIRIENARVSDLGLRTKRETEPNTSFGIDAGTIDITRFYVDDLGKLGAYPSQNGKININKAGPLNNWDLQNTDFESPVTAGIPQFWKGSNVSGIRTSSILPGSKGKYSFEYRTSGSSGSIYKSIPNLPEGTKLDMVGRIRILQAGGPSYWLEIRNLAGTTSKNSFFKSTTGSWIRAGILDYSVGKNQKSTLFSFLSSKGNAQVRLDDFSIHLSNWWDNDNFANMGFEDRNYHETGRYPSFWKAPDFWKVWDAQCVPSTSLSPGAPSGSRSVKVVTTNVQGLLFKDLTFIKPYDTFEVTGWVKGIPHAGFPCWIKVQIGEGATFWDTSKPYNKLVNILGDSTWKFFRVKYTAPSYPNKKRYTRLNFECWGGIGNIMFVDEIKVRFL